MEDLLKNHKKEFSFTDEDFTFLSELAIKQAGINLTTDKRELVYGRVAKRLRLLKIDNFKDYCSILKQENNEESSHFINSIRSKQPVTVSAHGRPVTSLQLGHGLFRLLGGRPHRRHWHQARLNSERRPKVALSR